MKVKKLVFVFVCLFVVGIMNASAEDYGIVIGDKQLTSSNSSVSGLEGTISYDAKSNILLLDNVVLDDSSDITGDAVIDIKSGKNITIVLKGKNVITTTKNVSGLFANSNVTIKGDGSLKINATSGYPIALSNSNLIIEDTYLNIKSDSSKECILADEGDISIKNSTVYAVGGSQGLQANNIVIDNSIVNPVGTTGSVEVKDSLVIKSLTGKKLYGYGFYDNEADKKEITNIETDEIADGETYYYYIHYGYGYFRVVPTEQDAIVDAPIVDTTKDVQDVTIGITENSVFDDVFKNAIVNAGIDVGEFNPLVEVAVDNLDDSNVPEDALDSFKAIAKENDNLNISSFFDISLNVKDSVTDSLIGSLDEVDSELTFNVVLPEETAKVEDGYTRTYYIIRYHNGVSEILDTSVNGNVITFKTDKFSAYAIAYSDVKNESVSSASDVVANPKTGDSIGLYMVTGILSVVGLASLCVYCYRRKQFN